MSLQVSPNDFGAKRAPQSHTLKMQITKPSTKSSHAEHSTSDDSASGQSKSTGLHRLLHLPFLSSSAHPSKPNRQEDEHRSARLSVPDVTQLYQHRTEPQFAVRTIVFVRHGKSVWNLEKDKGRLAQFRAGVSGAMELHNARTQSRTQTSAMSIVDAPLSGVGIEEAHALSQFLSRQSHILRKRRLSTLRSQQQMATPLKDAIRFLNEGLQDFLTTPTTPVDDHFVVVDGCDSDDMSPLSVNKSRLTVSANLAPDPELELKFAEEDSWSVNHLDLPYQPRFSVSSSETDRPFSGVAEPIQYGFRNDITDHPDYKRLKKAAESSLTCLRTVLEKLESNMYKAQYTRPPPSPSASAFCRPPISPIVPGKPEIRNKNMDWNSPIELDWIIDELNSGKPETSRIVSSNLRRAISTAAIAFWNRFSVNYFEKVSILPELQEIGKGVDTICCHDVASTPIEVSTSERESGLVNIGKLAHFYRNRLNWDHLQGKNFGESDDDARMRLHRFASWVFDQEIPVVVTIGHSTWIRQFFREFLATDSAHTAKNSKMSHSSVVAFRFCRQMTETGPSYQIYEGSITTLYRGFV